MVCKNLSFKILSLFGITLLLTVLSLSSLFAYYAYTANDIIEFISIIVVTCIGFFIMLFPVCKNYKMQNETRENYEIFTISEESEIPEDF